MAALIKKVSAADVDLIEGRRGEFTVWVGDQIVAQKTSAGFPADDEAVSAVRRALAATRPA